MLYSVDMGKGKQFSFHFITHDCCRSWMFNYAYTTGELYMKVDTVFTSAWSESTLEAIKKARLVAGFLRYTLTVYTTNR